MLSASWTFDTIEKNFRSSNAENLESVDQRAYRLSNFENNLTLGWLIPGLNALAHTLAGMAKAADFPLRTQTLTASNFVAFWSTDPKFLASKDLNYFSKCIKFQNTGSVLSVGFAQSKRLYFHRLYLVTLCKRSSMAVNLLIWIYHWYLKAF